MARIDDGFSTTYSFSAVSSVLFWEKTVTPPGIDGGGEIDITTMRNLEWRTKNPKQLKTLSESSVEVAYDPAIFDDILALLQVNNLITVHFPDGSTLDFWGFLNNFTPGALKEGDQPTAEIKIIPTNQNDSQVETAPVFTAAS